LRKFFIVRKQQIILLSSAVVLLILLVIFGKTINPNKPTVEPMQQPTVQQLNFNEILNNAKQNLSPSQKIINQQLEGDISKADNAQKVNVYNRLAAFWKDSARVYEPYLFYLAEAAKLESSEKTLTFAAQQFTSSLLEVAEPAIQNWLATNAKVLFDKALTINPNNDSSKIGLGACYILCNISDNPMTGILPVREIATKNPDNLYAQLVLGLGGKKSRQFDKAIDRFLIITKKQPNNLVIIIHLAECYEMKGDKINAKVWYLKAAGLVGNAEIKREIEKRISELK